MPPGGLVLIDPSRLGPDGPRVSRLGLGLAAAGRPGYVNLGHAEDVGPDRRVARLRTATWDLLDAAVAQGITYVDVARSYGRAEAFLGGWLAAHPAIAATVVVGSKWGYTYTAGWQVEAEVHEVKDHTLATLGRQWPETVAALGGPPALYQVHSATRDSGVLDRSDVLDELARLRDGGVLVGITTSGPDQGAVVEQALAIERGARPLFGCVQATWNLLERSVQPALVSAHEAGRAVIVKEALANGRLTARGDDPEARAALAALSSVARPDDPGPDDPGPDSPGPDALALAAALVQPWASVVLSGAVTVAQLRANARAVEVEPALARRANEAVRPGDPAAYWTTRRALPWT